MKNSISVLICLTLTSLLSAKTKENNIQSEMRIYGQKIINGKIAPTKDKATLECLDSLSHQSFITRQFFFDVYKAIALKADNGLFYIIGEYTMPYLQYHPDEALDNFKKLDPEGQNLFLTFLAYEIVRSGSNYRSGIDQYIEEIKRICRNCEQDSALLERFKTTILQKISEMDD